MCTETGITAIEFWQIVQSTGALLATAFVFTAVRKALL